MSKPAPESKIKRIMYHRVDGAVPPPDHIEIEIDLTRQDGVLCYWPDYSGEKTPCWETDFEISMPDWDQLTNGLRELATIAWRINDPPLLGGAMEWLEVQAGDSRWQIPADLCAEHAGLISAAYHSIRSLVPEAVWLDMASRRLEYQKQSGY
jgi:hypothetical protein